MTQDAVTTMFQIFLVQVSLFVKRGQIKCIYNPYDEGKSSKENITQNLFMSTKVLWVNSQPQHTFSLRLKTIWNSKHLVGGQRSVEEVAISFWI